MSSNLLDQDYTLVTAGKKFEILKKGTEFFMRASDKGVDLNDVNHVLVKNNIKVTSFINIRNAISSKLNEIVPIGIEKEKIIITVSNDQMRAYVTFCMTERELESKGKILDSLELALEEHGVVYGKDFKELLLMDKIQNNRDICIAEGMYPMDGLDSIVKVKDISQNRPKELEGGTVDHYDLGIINKVAANEWVGEWTKPSDGVTGITVTGKPIKPNKGRLIKIPYDKKNIIEVDEGDKIVLYARVNGALRVDPNGHVSVADHMIIEDVNFNTGNIDFDGSITINGTVEDGFSVIARDSIEIKGENGIGCVKEIISKEGDILLCGGINGKGKSIIKAVNVVSKYISNANIEAQNTVSSKNYILHSSITAKEILLETPSSQIVGGDIQGCFRIVTGNLGNDAEVKTNIQLQEINKEDVEKRMMEIADELEKHASKIISLDKLFITGNVPPEKVDHILNLKSELIFIVENLEKEFQNLKRMITMKENAEIKILRFLCPGVRISSKSEVKNISKKSAGTTVYCKNGVITLV